MARRRDRRVRSLPGEHEVRLTRKLERSLKQGHPWVWREALAGLEAAAPGQVVAVTDAKGAFVARGIVDDGPIGVRVFTTSPRERVGAELFARRIEAAAGLRDVVIDQETDAYRLLHGEGDRLPGFVCDVYGATAVLRFDGGGAAAWGPTAIETLEPVLRARGVSNLLVRSARRKERSLEVAFGTLPEGRDFVSEHGMKMLVDVVHGQKTGLFLDHRPSRRRVRELSRGLSVLNLYGYTGAFSTAAGLGGARRVVTVDIAQPALDLAEASWVENDLPPDTHETVAADVPRYLAELDETFDLIVSDPPSFAPRESALSAAIAAYEKLHVACLARLRPGGLYLAASCSSHVRREAFDATVYEASRRGRRALQLLGQWGAGEDHPRIPVFVEGDYLKAILVRA